MNFEPCTYEKLFAMEAQGSQADYDRSMMENFPESVLEENSRLLVHKGEPIAAFGIWPLPGDVGAGWMLFSQYGADMHPLAISRHVLRELDGVMGNYSRVMAVVDTKDDAAVRWAEWLGFSRLEEILGMEGEGYYEFVRVN